jgi:hypothetical protein
MKVNPCRLCGENAQKAKWTHANGVGWVHCDSCGNDSTPVDLRMGNDEIIAVWNRENPIS